VTLPPEDRMTELRQLFFESAGELVQKLNDEAMRLEKSPAMRRPPAACGGRCIR